MREYDLVIIGGGLSGLSAAVAAMQDGAKDILIVEREESLGGVLNQCIHVGFGDEYLNEEVTGPEFINYFEEKIKKENVEILTDTEVLHIDKNKLITFVGPKCGVQEVLAKCILLATGCRERYLGSINIATHKYTGIFTIGNAHRIVNLEGFLPGKQVVVSANSIWAIMVARRLTIEGAKIEGVVIDTEKINYFRDEDLAILSGFNIPIYYGYKIIDINGDGRVNEVKILNHKTKEEISLDCDALLLSVGYSSESDIAIDLGVEVDENKVPIVNEFATNISGVFACGSLIYGNEILMKKNIDGTVAGKKCAEYLKEYY